MAKLRRVACTDKDSKCMDQHSSIDRISMLPDELLVIILSFLTLKEATATGILSSRWRHLWAVTPKLDFDGTELLSNVRFGEGKLEFVLARELRNFVRWVNQGIALHKDSTIEEFRVYFNLTKHYKTCINSWLRYALSRKVQRLELNLTCDGRGGERKYNECYTFPYKLLHMEKGSMRQCNSIDFKYLREVSFHWVNVNGEALEFFLCNCHVLEDLSVSRSGDLLSLKIIQPFPAFKRLKISWCDNLSLLEIHDSNLVYLKYIGSKIHFDLDNVPMLVEIYIGGRLTKFVEDILLLLSSYLPQLEIFTIDSLDCSTRFDSWGETQMFFPALKMSNLKQLVVKIRTHYDASLLSLTNLIRASPCLQKFVLEVHYIGRHFIGLNEEIVGSYPHLKEVELLRYGGSRRQLELIRHFVKNAVALQKIIVDPRKFRMWPYYCALKSKDGGYIINDEMAARAHAKQELPGIVPPRIHLEIL